MTIASMRAVSAAILHNGRFLLVRRGRAPALGLYAFPGGRVEVGETLEQAVRREVMEETGAKIAHIEHVVDLDIVAEDDENRIEFVLGVHAAEFSGGTIAPGDDADAVMWASIEDMESLPLAAFVLETARRLVASRQEQDLRRKASQ